MVNLLKLSQTNITDVVGDRLRTLRTLNYRPFIAQSVRFSANLTHVLSNCTVSLSAATINLINFHINRN